MVIDPSALIAILNDEPERKAFTEAIEQADTRLLSAAGFVEVSIIIDNRYGYDGRRDLDLLIAESGIEIIEVDEDQARFARDAFRQYGKGRHAAGLNFGDCFSYALAKVAGLPLLCKGNDFTQTGIPTVNV
jgi:ribonuclease VapC